MVRIAMGHDQSLMLLEAEIAHEPIGHLNHSRAVDCVVRVEGERDVVDRLLGASRPLGRHLHETACGVRIVGREVPRLSPGYAIGVARFEVTRE